MASSFTTRRVRSGDLSLSLREHSPGGPGRPTVVLVHGYPDRQGTWERLIERLPLDAWHVVTYDVRGAGGSDVPDRAEGYRTERLVDDLVAVLDDVLADGERVHLVGHDWGSVQLWDAVVAESTDPRLRGRIASFTSISGPSLDHMGAVLRRSRGRRLRALNQALHSWYVYAFHVPLLPELAWSLAHARIGRAITSQERMPRGHFGPGLGADAANGLNLYRANVFHRLPRPTPLHTDVPVLVVHPTRDRFLTDVLLEDLDRRCSDLRIEQVEAGHWVIVTHPEWIAELVEEHVGTH